MYLEDLQHFQCVEYAIATTHSDDQVVLQALRGFGELLTRLNASALLWERINDNATRLKTYHPMEAWAWVWSLESSLRVRLALGIGLSLDLGALDGGHECQMDLGGLGPMHTLQVSEWAPCMATCP